MIHVKLNYTYLVAICLCRLVTPKNIVTTTFNTQFAIPWFEAFYLPSLESPFVHVTLLASLVRVTCSYRKDLLGEGHHDRGIAGNTKGHKIVVHSGKEG